MPILPKLLAIIGTAAMIWVGAGILMHGLEDYGLSAPAHITHQAAEFATTTPPFPGGVVGWLVTALATGSIGLMVGGFLIPPTSFVQAPTWQSLTAPGRAAAPLKAVLRVQTRGVDRLLEVET